MNLNILAIESSCDETSVAIVRNGKEVLSNIVASQIDIHKEYGGVVPEIASRHHIEIIMQVINEALATANMDMGNIDAICVTQGPGLVGSLLVGVTVAKTLAYVYEKKLIAAHHIAGHIYSANIDADIKYPSLALVVSGGHTELVLLKDELNFEIIGQTQDDAVGEAYDKVARQLDLEYPGGPKLDSLAKIGKDSYNLPRAMIDSKNYNFSFSGMKSAIINLIHNKNQRGEVIVKEDLARSFQTAVMDILEHKTKSALEDYGISQLIVSGGVAGNSELRSRMINLANNLDIDLLIPKMKYCSDNAAMIGAVGYYYYKHNLFADPLTLNAKSSISLEKIK
ncbi:MULTISPECIES: tRNA (adenosine(37)-N6)-threonylcarbamoyltransferase complex transferase subunit TsaD [unclassified Gemella]|uniref:tRNA (adenosine(37)-N6)-threonylcarbamoyltransferase complex transferase subunit TsaD n=1 Tax=unclassified Gemella TaxID=2624949 RepID=UPI001073E32E|nr:MULTISPECIES: tRNA (adenosine(37)-N6)-threonylcarbamoyltransferase complex transferase subunit TsaD [unclassified Gemella]MBF0709664.1 tRNA (adenosine(37)-N6)-threonylcarbamoyltransferase complex transferase subunit TsaD [Gemella sp. GL1.1]MBF0746917.1 tRNA (adenosine(37)-N6)-threonylcarbamoyltransferase complex transferase subunit TsaD [Gemella sp. 19428wG2_WT2a]NYS27008.1 tRNA (adenosine(37)-N6)-threonylcarbamoyltransferase complex transferase subunit TsaD [Gemella sp. GL1]TFU59143.1 tRNA 